jgi:hypothetical protein
MTQSYGSFRKDCRVARGDVIADDKPSEVYRMAYLFFMGKNGRVKINAKFK